MVRLNLTSLVLALGLFSVHAEGKATVEKVATCADLVDILPLPTSRPLTMKIMTKEIDCGNRDAPVEVLVTNKLAIHAKDKKLTLKNVRFTVEGGGDLAVTPAVVFRDTTSSSAAGGGALKVEAGGRVTFHATSVFRGIRTTDALAQGGAINNRGMIVFMGRAVFTGNTSANSGGAIANRVDEEAGEVGSIVFRGSLKMKGNTSMRFGGALSNLALVAVRGRAALDDNTAGLDSGAIDNFGVDATLVFWDTASLTANTATGDGGHCSNAGGATLTFKDAAKFFSGAAGRFGGALSLSAAPVTTFTDRAVFNDNEAGGGCGGAIASDGTAPVSGLENASFAGNSPAAPTAADGVDVCEF